MRSRRTRPIGASVGARVAWLLVGAGVLTACSGGSDQPNGVGAGGEATSLAPVDTVGSLATDPLATDPLSTDPLSTDQVVTTPPSTLPPAEPLPVLAVAPQSAGPLVVTASPCVVTGIPNEAPGAAIGALAIDANRAYVPVDGGVAALALASGPDCTLTLDPTVGSGGLFATADDAESVSVASSGRLAATGLFGTTVFDTTSGVSYECDDATGTSDLTPDGRRLLTWFPGSPVQQFELTDESCGAASPVAIPGEFTDVVFVGAASSDDGDLFVGGERLDGSIAGGRSIDGASRWTVGNVEVGGAGWIGWVDGMAPCADGYCVLDTNTDKLIVVDAVGALRAEFAVSALIGARMSYHALEPGPDGALYLLASASAADGDGGTIEGVYVVRLEVTG